ncbi:MAG: BolA family transcriptional regulator [Chlamydiae bacterium]|nr:BolA family transcriptional regulator [Chlamydiota bacterium]
MKEALISKLKKEFVPIFLDVQDLSDLHKGHAGHSPAGETHFKVVLVSRVFKDKSRLERHQRVYKVLEKEIQNLHALELILKTPEESRSDSVGRVARL